jgi:hypothetical protein
MKSPSLEQLRIAQEIGRGLSAAIRNGDDLGSWELVKRAHDALFAKMNARRAVVAQIDDLRNYHERDARLRESRAARNRPAHVDGPGEGLPHRASKTLESLVGLDRAFRSVNLACLIKLVRNSRLAPLGIATKLSLQCGAFGDARQSHESDVNAQKRVKRLFERSRERLPT